MTTITSSTGGKIVPTKNGLIHYANIDRLITESESVQSDQTLTYDFSQFPTTVPVNTVPGRIITFK